jgi:hypothetical protein
MTFSIRSSIRSTVSTSASGLTIFFVWRTELEVSQKFLCRRESDGLLRRPLWCSVRKFLCTRVAELVLEPKHTGSSLCTSKVRRFCLEATLSKSASSGGMRYLNCDVTTWRLVLLIPAAHCRILFSKLFFSVSELYSYVWNTLYSVRYRHHR